MTEIEAARQLLIQDMKTLEGIAPESGAYFNEVRVPRLFTVLRLSSLEKKNIPSRACRRRDMNSTGRDRSSGLTTISSERSSRSGIRIRCSSFTKASDRTSGTQISSAESEIAPNHRTHWHWLSEEPGWPDTFFERHRYGRFARCIRTLNTQNQRHYLYQPIQCAGPNRDQTMGCALPGWSHIQYAAADGCVGAIDT